ncbi:hypothetical protein IJJ53_03150 [Candidatus Saccharibacteria bacterium]|nr:hypothetical protein [Candidatus Saccharibacteria bacterium]
MTVKKKQNRKSFKDIVKYNFDNLLMRGAGAQILLLIAMTGIMAIVFGLILFITTSEGGPAGSSIWTVLVHSLDPGVLSNSNGSPWFLFILLVVTLLGLFSVGTLISIITASMSKALDQLSHGKSKIVEPKKHILFLGYNEISFEVLRNIFEHNEKDKSFQIGKQPVVILEQYKDIVDIKEEIEFKFREYRKTKVICRQGCIFDVNNYDMCSIEKAKQIIITAVSDEEAAETVLACRKALEYLGINKTPITVVLDKNSSVEQMKIVGGDEIKIVVKEEVAEKVLEKESGSNKPSFVLNTKLAGFIPKENVIILADDALGSEESDRKTILGIAAMKENIEKTKSTGDHIRVSCEIRLKKNAILAKAAGADEVVVTNVEVGKLVFE